MSYVGEIGVAIFHKLLNDIFDFFSQSQYEGSIYSPETAQQQMVVARRRATFKFFCYIRSECSFREFEQEITTFRQNMQQQQNAIYEQQRQVATARREVQEQEANNWREKSVIVAQQANVDHQLDVIRKEKEILAERERLARLLEDQRRRNRTVSAAYIEDSFATLTPKAVVENLTNSSNRIRKHAMDNISACVSGNSNASAFVRFSPEDIAPFLLPKLHQLVSSTNPIDSVVRFAEEVASSPPMAKALAQAGQCGKLAEYLIEANELVSRLAICSLRQMVRMETPVVKPAYEAMSVVISLVPIRDDPQQSEHPSVDFLKEVAPKIIEDCFNNGLWGEVAPLVGHRIGAIRHVALRKVVLSARQSERNQEGIADAHILGSLNPYYQLSSPPPDTVDFFTELLPLVAEKLCRRHGTEAVQWLLKYISHPNSKISATVIDVFRACTVNEDPTIFQLFVKARLLAKLDEPPVQQSFAITTLICQLLPALAVPFARARAAEGVVRFLDHGEPAVATSCLTACIKIVESTLEDRTHLFEVVSRLDSAKESTLKLYDRALPTFCKDWASSGDYHVIVQHLRHSERRIRLPTQKVWYDIIYTSSTARSKIVHDDLLDVVFELCDSQYDDSVNLGAKCSTLMAIEVTKAGVSPTRKLVALLNHPNALLRHAALRGVQLAAESSDANCQVLLEAEAFDALQSFFEIHPKELPDIAHKILTRLAAFLRSSPEACAGLLRLLESNSHETQHSARAALSTISNTNIENRETLRIVVLNRLELPTEALIEFAAKAIKDWIGPDLSTLNDFSTFFSLLEHSDRRIQNAALSSLKTRLSNDTLQESFEKANIFFTLRSLSNSDNPEALNFVAVALRQLALSLARHGHTSKIINLLAHKEPKVCEGAAAALEAVAGGSARDRKLLLEEDIIERLIGHDQPLEQTQIQLLFTIIPLLALAYLEAGKADLLFKLVDHSQQQIRTATSKAIMIIASGTTEQRATLRDALLPRLDQASQLLCEVTADCLTRSLADDLITDGDFIRIFRIFLSEDVRVRQPMLDQLQAYIQGSDEATRRRLVDAKILPALLQAYSPAKNDILDFMSNCLLPMLGPSFTQDNGGLTLFPLLSHDEHRLRAAAVQALRNAMDSRHGNMENMAKAHVIGTLKPLTASDDIICDLWCRILPKVAPYLSSRAEIDILFDNLNDERGNVREAVSEAISILARTSEATRTAMLPTLLRHLENPLPSTLPSITEAVSFLGHAFISSGDEAELLRLVLEGQGIGVAAVEAITGVLAKGSSLEHQRLVKANPDVLTIALKLHSQPSQRQHSLKLLKDLVTYVSYLLIQDEELARELFFLFGDPDPGLQNTIYHTWSSDSRVYQSDVLPELLPILLEDERLRNPSVRALLQELAPAVVPKLLARRRLDILVMALKVADANTARSFLQEACSLIKKSNDEEKKWFATEPFFISAVGEHLKGHDTTMRRNASTVIQLLSAGSASRSGNIMEEGIGEYLSFVAVNGEKGAQQSSLRALYSLLMAAPDRAGRLVEDSLPALCDILEQEDLSFVVYTEAFRLLTEIAQQSPHLAIIESGIVQILVKWLSPLFSVTDPECKKYVFRICQLIARNSDAGRKALIDAGILPELSSLARSQMVLEVVSSCQILKALAHTGTFRQDIILAGLKTSMEHITSPIRKSTLRFREDRVLAQNAAREALETLKSSKRQNVESLLRAQATQRPSSRRYSEARHFEDPPHRHLVRERRSASESAVPSDYDNALQSQREGEDEESPAPARHIRHSRSMSEPNRPAVLRSQHSRLSAVQEDSGMLDSRRLSYADQDLEEPESEVDLVVDRRSTIRNPTEHLRSPDTTISSGPGPIRLDPTVIIERPNLDDDLATDIVSPSVVMSSSRTAPPSYRPLASVSGSMRRTALGRDYSRNSPVVATAEDTDIGPSTSRSTGTRRSYKVASSSTQRK